MSKEQERIEKPKITFQDFIRNVGYFFAGTSIVAYLAILYIVVFGFEAAVSNEKLAFFLLLGNLAGIMSSIGFRIQGVDNAKNTDEGKKVNKEYSDLLATDKNVKLRPLWVFHLINTLKDIFTKGLTTFVTLYFTITIIIDGLGDAKYFGLGIANIFMYVGFGLIALSKAYEHYIEREIPRLKQKIIRMKEEQNGNVKTDTDSNRSGRDGAGGSRSTTEGAGISNGRSEHNHREVQNFRTEPRGTQEEPREVTEKST